jgi:hypothetical protein
MRITNPTGLSTSDTFRIFCRYIRRYCTDAIIFISAPLLWRIIREKADSY